MRVDNRLASRPANTYWLVISAQIGAPGKFVLLRRHVKALSAATTGFGHQPHRINCKAHYFEANHAAGDFTASSLIGAFFPPG